MINTMTTKQELGKVRLKFNDDGNVCSVVYINCFIKTVPVFTSDILKTGVSESAICESAKSVLADAFAIVNDAELADREKYTISSVPQDVIRNEAGIITDITVSFSLDEL